MGSVNKVIIIGYLGRDPEVRSMQDGRKVVNLSVATSESWKDRASGDRRERTEWHKVTVWAEHAVNFAERYLRKGDQVYLEGALQTRKWTDQQGQDRYTTEIVVQQFRGELTSLNGRGQGGSGGDGAGAAADDWQAPPRGGNGGGRAADLDDEIPF